MHLHLCSQCRAIITVDEGRNCPSTSDHEEMLAETSSTRHIAFSLDSGDQIDDALSQSIRLVVQRGKRSLRGGPALIDSAGTRPARALPLEERGSRLGH